MNSANAPINVLQSAVKREIFKPIFMNFPILDRLPFPSRARARETVSKFKNELKRALIESQKHNPLFPTSPEGLGRRMLEARDSGSWTEKQLLDNLTVAFVAGQENPQLCMISTLYLLAKHPVSFFFPRLKTDRIGSVADWVHRMCKTSFTPKLRAKGWISRTRIRKRSRTCLF